MRVRLVAGVAVAAVIVAVVVAGVVVSRDRRPVGGERTPELAAQEFVAALGEGSSVRLRRLCLPEFSRSGGVDAVVRQYGGGHFLAETSKVFDTAAATIKSAELSGLMDGGPKTITLWLLREHRRWFVQFLEPSSIRSIPATEIPPPTVPSR
jgi:hypothetical protein